MWIRVRDLPNSKKERLDLEDPAGQHAGHIGDEDTGHHEDDWLEMIMMLMMMMMTINTLVIMIMMLIRRKLLRI